MDVESAVASALKEQGVEVYPGYLLAEFNDSANHNELYAVSFTSSTKPVRIECQAFFAYYKNMVDFDAFKGG